ncbi:MAG: response regulator [Deltaproteobacteria bacterium]|nr:response regulator [Deltaproteobacteria bacterium]
MLRLRFKLTSKKKSNTEETSRVLIADDNAAIRKYLASQLEVMGFHVVAAATTGEEAVTLYDEFKPDLVIMDVKMPEMDGIEAAKIITGRLPVPIILITGHSSASLVERAIESGVFAYIVKPITKKDLLPAIRLAFARFNEFKTLKTEVGNLKDTIETRKLVEKAKGILMKRLSISEDDAFKLLQSQSQKENKKLRDIAETVITASKLI